MWEVKGIWEGSLEGKGKFGNWEIQEGKDSQGKECRDFGKGWESPLGAELGMGEGEENGIQHPQDDPDPNPDGIETLCIPMGSSQSQWDRIQPLWISRKLSQSHWDRFQPLQIPWNDPNLIGISSSPSGFPWDHPNPGEIGSRPSGSA